MSHKGSSRPELPEEQLRDLYEDAPCGYLSTTVDGRIVKANQTILRWLGHTAEDVVGVRRFTDLLTAGGRIYTETHYVPLLMLQGRAREIAFDMRRADGSVLPVLVNSTVVSGPDGEAQLIRTSVFDATERREYERELLRARERAQQSEERARVLAQTLQASLIPPAPPQIPGLEVAAVYRPAGEGDQVGGDFYDVFEIGGREWVVVLGDVSGKGAGAAVVTALARYTMRAAAMRSGRPRDVLGELNRALLGESEERYCTVVCLHLQRDTGGHVWVTVASGGHPLPLAVTPPGRRDEGPSVVPVGDHGTMLGVTRRPVLRETTMRLEPGQRLFCYTDGFIEGRAQAGETGLPGDFYGEDRLLASLHRHAGDPVATLVQSVADEVVDFQDGTTKDDMAAVVVGLPDTHAGSQPHKEWT